MGPFPFIRFESIEQNAGFMPQSLAQSNLLNTFFGSYTTNDFVGLNYLAAIAIYEAKILELNLPINGGNLRLVFPKPFPAIAGAQVIVFKVLNNQLFAIKSAQVVNITLTLNNGIIALNSYSFSGIVTDTAAYEDPIIEAEKQIQTALYNYSQNGASVIPGFYTFVPSTLSAYSRLIRAKDWRIVADKINRLPLPTNPFRGIDYIQVQPFKQDQKYILSQFTLIIRKTFEGVIPIADLLQFASQIIWPAGWVTTLTAYDLGSGTAKLVIMVIKGSEGFSLIGNFNTKWTFQRFYSDLTPPAGVPLNLPGWPHEPNTGRFYDNKWYDLEQLEFIHKVDPLSEDSYCQPVKSSDQLQFNIIKETANLLSVDTCSIGIFDCNKVFLQKVGEAQYPKCKADSTFVNTILSIPISTIISTIATNGANTIFTLVVDDFGVNTTLVVPFGSTDTSTGFNYGNSVVAYINGLPGYAASFVIVASTIAFYITINDLETNVKKVNWAANPMESIGTVKIRCVSATQFYASVIIPSLKTGSYYFGLYNLVGTVSEIYSFSNVLALNNNEDFTQIVEIGSGEDELIEGFEYFKGWLQRIRVALNGAGQTVKIEESIYRNSDGTFQKPVNSSDENISLHTDYLDLATQRSMTSATRHPIFVLNGQNLSVQDDLEIATVQDHTTNQSFRKLQQMKFSAKIQGYQPENNACLG